MLKEITSVFIVNRRLVPTVAHSCDGKTKNLTAKTKYLTAKPKTSRQARTKTSRQNQKPQGKTKDLTAKPNTSQQKPNTSRQKQIPTAKPKLFCFCCEVFGFSRQKQNQKPHGKNKIPHGKTLNKWTLTKIVMLSGPQLTTDLRYHPPSSTLLALIGASAFAFNKYPHKPYIFWRLNSSSLLLIPFKKSKY